MTNLKLLTSLCKFCWPTFWSTQQLEVKKKNASNVLGSETCLFKCIKKTQRFSVKYQPQDRTVRSHQCFFQIPRDRQV